MKRSGTSPSLPSGYYWLTGIHPVQMALNNPQRVRHRLLVTANSKEKLRIPQRISLEVVEQETLNRLLPAGTTHQGVALAVQPLSSPPLEDLLANAKPLLMLDQVTDPHNIGAILRSAAAFGAGGVIVQDKHSPAENATIAKTAAGALEVIPYLAVTNLSRTIEAAQQAGYWAIGLEGTASQTLKSCKPSAKTLLVMGAEGAGLRRLVAEHCDMLAKLPISPQMESLNVSVAAGIALYEIASS
jgi:23S rRNA (guanosine2251-2'-O)-methyltransferase